MFYSFFESESSTEAAFRQPLGGTLTSGPSTWYRQHHRSGGTGVAADSDLRGPRPTVECEWVVELFRTQMQSYSRRTYIVLRSPLPAH